MYDTLAFLLCMPIVIVRHPAHKITKRLNNESGNTSTEVTRNFKKVCSLATF